MPKTPPRASTAYAMRPPSTSSITCSRTPSSTPAGLTTGSPARVAQARKRKVSMAICYPLLRIHGEVVVDAEHAVLALRVRRGDRDLLLGLDAAGQRHHAAIGVDRDVGPGHAGVGQDRRLDLAGDHRVRERVALR